MDQALVRFRKDVVRENRDRESVRRRYSAQLQKQAVAYWRGRQQQGDGLRDVAAALGVAPWSLYRWTRVWDERERFHPVEVVAAARSERVAPVVVLSADGVRVEGLDVGATAHLLRLLR
jgi:transposase-like protein